MKKKLIGYSVQNVKGEVVEELKGTQPRRTLNKFRKANIVRKIYANSRS